MDVRPPSLRQAPLRGRPCRPGRARHVVLLLVLLVLCLVLAGLLAAVLRNYPSADEPAQKLLLRLAWTAAVLLGICLVALMWMFIRWLRARLTPAPLLPKTEYVDAWAEAGRRIRVPGEKRIDVLAEDDSLPETPDENLFSSEDFDEDVPDEDNGEFFDEDDETFYGDDDDDDRPPPDR